MYVYRKEVQIYSFKASPISQAVDSPDLWMVQSYLLCLQEIGSLAGAVSTCKGVNVGRCASRYEHFKGSTVGELWNAVKSAATDIDPKA